MIWPLTCNGQKLATKLSWEGCIGSSLSLLGSEFPGWPLLCVSCDLFASTWKECKGTGRNLYYLFTDQRYWNFFVYLLCNSRGSVLCCTELWRTVSQEESALSWVEILNLKLSAQARWWSHPSYEILKVFISDTGKFIISVCLCVTHMKMEKSEWRMVRVSGKPLCLLVAASLQHRWDSRFTWWSVFSGTSLKNRQHLPTVM